MTGSTVVELRRALDSGEITSEALVEQRLAVAHASQARLNAFTELLDDRALAEARRADVRIAAGAPRGPLDGIPFAVKDNIFVGRLRCTWGSRRWRDHRALESDVCTSRLADGGAVLLGITNTPELSSSQITTSELYGVTRNPVDPALTPGGSSGGSAAVVAAGIVPFALGTDAGGSTRTPASLTGVYGLRPSNGAIPRVTGFPALVPEFQVIAILAAELDDVGVVLEITGGPDARDPASLSYRQRAPAPAPRIGWFDEVEGVRCDPVVSERLRGAVLALRAQGLEVDRIVAPYSLNAVVSAWDTLSAVGVSMALAQAPSPFEPIAPGLEQASARGRATTGEDYRTALDTLADIRRTASVALSDVDIVLCPSTVTAAWPADSVSPLGTDGTLFDPAILGAFTHWVNALGFAALSVPARPLDDGRPIGIQLVAASGCEPTLFAVARRLAALRAGVPQMKERS